MPQRSKVISYTKSNTHFFERSEGLLKIKACWFERAHEMFSLNSKYLDDICARHEQVSKWHVM